MSSDVLEAVAASYDRVDDDAAAWEPIRFEVGQRVRVHLSAECRTGRRPGSDEIGHSPDEEGLVGTIADEAAPPLCYWPRHHFEGHPYVVDFGRPVRIDGIFSYGAMYYAASELIPLDPDARGAGEREDA